jgi:hypothetical protein
MWTTPFGDSLFNDHPFATFDAGAGVVHHINRYTAPAARPTSESALVRKQT